MWILRWLSFFFYIFTMFSTRSPLQIYISSLPIIHVEFLQMDLSTSSKISVLKNFDENLLNIFLLNVCGWNFFRFLIFQNSRLKNSKILLLFGGLPSYLFRKLSRLILIVGLWSRFVLLCICSTFYLNFSCVITYMETLTKKSFSKEQKVPTNESINKI